MIVPVKALPRAKSRLIEATADADGHAALVRAIRADTIAAAHDAEPVSRVVVIADAPGSYDHDVLVQSRPGLNEALAEASRYAAEHWPGDGVAALVGDLPALTAAELTEALTIAADHRRAFVPDAESTGTTLLTARPGVPLEPRFGAGSAARHAVRAIRLSAGPGLRTDVDTPDDLRRAEQVGLGSHTSAVRCPQASTC